MRCGFLLCERDPTQGRQPPDERVNRLNRLIAGAAVKLVIAQGDGMRDRIREHFGTVPRTSMFEYLVRFRRSKIESPVTHLEVELPDLTDRDGMLAHQRTSC